MGLFNNKQILITRYFEFIEYTMRLDDVSDMGTLSLEAAGSALIMVIVFKIYRMRCKTRSGCCGDHLHIETENFGANNPIPPTPQV